MEYRREGNVADSAVERWNNEQSCVNSPVNQRQRSDRDIMVTDWTESIDNTLRSKKSLVERISSDSPDGSL